MCRDLLRGACELVPPYATQLSALLQEEGREQDLALVEALGRRLLEAVAAARVEAATAPPTAEVGDNGEVSIGMNNRHVAL
jgi:hypothetical protein